MIPRSLALLALALVSASQAAALDWLGGDLDAPVARDPHGWAGSDTCLTCHADHHRSWSRTWHRTMTQAATTDSVLGRFDGQVLDYWGVLVRPVRHEDRYFFEYLNRETGEPFKRLPVERTVGSHRYQQYLTRQEQAGKGNYWRLPMIWLIREQRWTHVNGVFLGSDEQGFDDHLALWNQNCIFCHNTGPVPNIRNLDALKGKGARGEPIDWRFEPRYRSHVAELGIACESCHGPGQLHAERNRNPLRRYRLHLSDRADPTIVNPDRLDHQAATDVCGQCHGQRVPRIRSDILEWLQRGPSYRAGEELNAHVEPIRRHTSPVQGNDEEQFRLRFWPDGTPRLSAYEYQGTTMSACFRESELSCITCHSGHEGDPAGMISAENRGNGPCLDCHEAMAADVTAHTRHAEDSEGSRCYNCHMPKMVYGVMAIHRSHRIERPDPAAAAESGRPDACTNCHVEGSTAWAAQALTEGWGLSEPEPDLETMPRLVADLLSGDPVQRAIAAEAAGRIQNGDQSGERAFLVPFLIMTLADDYPMLRWFARNSLLSLAPSLDPGLVAGLEEWDYIADEAQRRPLLDTLNKRWAALDKSGWPRPELLPLDDNWLPLPEVIEPLLAQRSDKEIEIGE